MRHVVPSPNARARIARKRLLEVKITPTPSRPIREFLVWLYHVIVR